MRGGPQRDEWYRSHAQNALHIETLYLLIEVKGSINSRMFVLPHDYRWITCPSESTIETWDRTKASALERATSAIRG